MAYGSFSWYELMTTDAPAALDFYGKVVGWTARPAGVGDMDYTILNVGDYGIGGVMTLTREACDQGARPGWVGYVVVEDLDAAVEKLKSLGGAVHRPPQDIPGVLRFSVVADPQGAVFIMFQNTSAMEPPPAPPPTTPGMVAWRELMAGDGEKAFDFYSAMFGWTKSTAMPMGEMGVYQLFAYEGADQGGMMTKPPQIPAPYWGYYFVVDSVEAAIERLTAAGGKVVNGPVEVPGGAWIVNAVDPQGAFFSLTSAGK